MARRSLSVIAAAAAVAAVLAGCQAPGTAAKVNGERITDRQVNAYAIDLLEYRDYEIAPSDVLINLALERILTPIAEDNGVFVSDQEALAAFNQGLAADGSDPVGLEDISDSSVRVMRLLLSSQAIPNLPNGAEVIQEFETAATQADIEVNPRYGLEFQDGLFAPASDPWIADTAGSRVAG